MANRLEKVMAGKANGKQKLITRGLLLLELGKYKAAVLYLAVTVDHAARANVNALPAHGLS